MANEQKNENPEEASLKSIHGADSTVESASSGLKESIPHSKSFDMSGRLKGTLITIGIYGSILIPMFVIFGLENDNEIVQSKPQQLESSPFNRQFVVLRAKAKEKLKPLGITWEPYRDDIGVYVDAYPQAAPGEKVTLKIGGIKYFIPRDDIRGLAPVTTSTEKPAFNAILPLR